MQNTDFLKSKWDKLTIKLATDFGGGEDIDLDGIVYLIGIQELGVGDKNFKKDEKINLMHIAICKLLEPYGYYEFDFYDNEGWPHYNSTDKLPNLKPGEQKRLVKEAIINYFDNSDFI